MRMKTEDDYSYDDGFKHYEQYERNESDDDYDAENATLINKLDSNNPLPDVRNAYAIISSEESHRVVVFGSHASTSHRSQSSVFVSNVVGKGNFQSFYEVLDLPNDKRRHTSATIYGINFSHIGSPTSAQIKNELGHSLGFSSSTSENDITATCEDNNINSEDLLTDSGLLACKPSIPLEHNIAITNETSVLRYLKASPGDGIHIVRNHIASFEAFVDADWTKCVVSVIRKEKQLDIDDKFEFPSFIRKDNAFNGMNGGDVTDHITKVLEITEWIKMDECGKDETTDTKYFSKITQWKCQDMWNNEITKTLLPGVKLER
ncbi:hypothetical protein Tco_1185533 [Tanacetum coccineum]